MAITLKQQIEELRKLKRRLTVWEAIHHLVDDKFISKDGRKVGGIRVPNTDDLVPEDEIEDVLEYMAEGPIKDIKEKIENLENMTIVVIDSTETDLD